MTNLAAFTNEAGWFCGVCHIGGADGFGISFSRPVTSVYGYNLATWGNYSFFGTSYSRLAPADANTYGVTYKGQDDSCKGAGTGCNTPADYSFAHGALTYQIRTIGCGPIQAFAKYAHTWSSNAVTGFGVGPWSLSVSWATSGESWERASQPSSVVTPC